MPPRSPLANAPSLCLFCRSHLASLPRPVRRSYTRPPQAPKSFLDVKHIARNPGLYAQNATARNYPAASSAAWDIAALDRRRKELTLSSHSPRDAEREIRRKIERLRLTERESGRDITGNSVMAGLLSQAQKAKKDLVEWERELADVEKRMQDLAWLVPNLSSVHTPETEPTLLEQHGTRDTSRATSHVDIGAALDILDFSSASTTSGWGWYFLKNAGAMLEQALVHFALAKLRARGWIVVTPPSIVYEHIAAGCGFQPRDAGGEEQIYRLESKHDPADAEAKPVRVLAGTAEIPLAGMHAGQKLRERDLPLKVVGASRCYRAEAGARGADTKGLYRVHEFTKVEMFGWTAPDERGDDNFSVQPTRSASAELFAEMLAVQQEMLRELGLAYRVLEMPATDLGASASRKVDMEAWFPSRQGVDAGWGEVSSASICTDYQTRRLGTRVKRRDGGLALPHTVNGTAMAVPRVWAAVVENGWDEGAGVVRLPECLWKWMEAETIGREKGGVEWE